MKSKPLAFFVTFVVLSCARAIQAEVQLAQLFCDHMVMQRSMMVPVWGWAERDEEVTVSIDRQTKLCKADGAGKWIVRLDRMEAGEPRKMIVKGKANAVEVSDILVGEVWICSGQSNMAWPLKQALNGDKEVADADHPEIRLFSVPYAETPNGPVDRIKVTPPNRCLWELCSPKTAGDFSAVGYFFGRELQHTLQVPVGLISHAVGGSSIESWISRDAFMRDSELKVVAEYFDGLANYVENTAKGKKEFHEMSERYDALQADARSKGMPALWPPKFRSPLYSGGFGSSLFNGLTNPLIPYAMRGVIWYQGEAQWRWMYEYRGVFPLLIKDWRSRWGQGDFPFLFVQLPNWAQPNREPDAGGWALLRESQLATLNVPNTAMAVTIDIGDANSIHPTNKLDVGRRLSLAARHAAYGENIVFSGPIYREMTVEGAAIRVSFDHVGGGLMIGKKTGLEPAAEEKRGTLRRFSIAGEDMKFVWADAVIQKDSVLVSFPSVLKPVAVRYAWSNNPDGCNLYNKEGLPASPFRTDRDKGPAMGAYYKAKKERGFTLQPEK